MHHFLHSWPSPFVFRKGEMKCPFRYIDEIFKCLKHRVWHSWDFRSQQIYSNICVLKKSHELVFGHVWCEKKIQTNIQLFLHPNFIFQEIFEYISNELDTNMIFVTNSILSIFWSLLIVKIFEWIFINKFFVARERDF